MALKPYKCGEATNHLLDVLDIILGLTPDRHYSWGPLHGSADVWIEIEAPRRKKITRSGATLDAAARQILNDPLRAEYAELKALHPELFKKDTKNKP
jgi:hypothetical protein